MCFSVVSEPCVGLLNYSECRRSFRETCKHAGSLPTHNFDVTCCAAEIAHSTDQVNENKPVSYLNNSKLSYWRASTRMGLVSCAEVTKQLWSLEQISTTKSSGDQTMSKMWRRLWSRKLHSLTHVQLHAAVILSARCLGRPFSTLLTMIVRSWLEVLRKGVQDTELKVSMKQNVFYLLKKLTSSRKGHYLIEENDAKAKDVDIFRKVLSLNATVADPWGRRCVRSLPYEAEHRRFLKSVFAAFKNSASNI